MKLKTRALFILTVVLSLILSACAAESPAEYKVLTAEEAKARIDSGDALIILDVRTQEEYDAGHIPGAVLLPNEDIGSEPPAILADKDAEILVYCRSGNRSRQAAQKLIAMGYTQVYDFGGINSWPYDVVTDETYDGILSSFTTVDTDGNPVDQTLLTGKRLTMLNIWATFCGPCLNEMPELAELNREYAEQGFQIIGLPVDVSDIHSAYISGGAEKLADAIADTGADYLHILPSESLYTVLANSQYVPETLFVDEHGVQVGESYVGAKSKAEWAAIIENLLKTVK